MEETLIFQYVLKNLVLEFVVHFAQFLFDHNIQKVHHNIHNIQKAPLLKNGSSGIS